MANNCIVTALKGIVNNDGLPKLGEIKVKVLDPLSFKFDTHTVSVNARTVGDALYYLDSSGSKTGSAFESGQVYNGTTHKYGIGVADSYTGNVFLESDYSIQDIWINSGSCDLSVLTYNRSIHCENTEGGAQLTGYPSVRHEMYIANVNPSDANLKPFTSVLDTGMWIFTLSPGSGVNNCVLSIRDFIKNKPNIERFIASNFLCEDMGSTGYADLGKLDKLVRLNHNPKYSWTLEDFVHNKRSVGVTTGQVVVDFGNDSAGGGICSFNGQKLAESSSTITWTATQMTYNGVTIDS